MELTSSDMNQLKTFQNQCRNKDVLVLVYRVVWYMLIPTDSMEVGDFFK